MPALSIIIPTFNSASTIERCLRSIAVQPTPDYEVLIQDGGSTDDTVRLIRHYQESNPQMALSLSQEEDTGVYDAMNKAMRRARGEWLYFLGSNDELYDPDVLRAMTGSPLAENGGVLYGNVWMVPVDSSAEMGFIHDGQFNLNKLSKINICHQAILYKRSFLFDIGEYETKYPLYGDWDFNLRCWAKEPFTFVDVVVAKFYMGGISTSGRRDKRFEVEIVPLMMRLFNAKLYGPILDAPDFFGANEAARMRLERGAAFVNFCRITRSLRRLKKRIRPLVRLKSAFRSLTREG